MTVKCKWISCLLHFNHRSIKVVDSRYSWKANFASLSLPLLQFIRFIWSIRTIRTKLVPQHWFDLWSNRMFFNPFSLPILCSSLSTISFVSRALFSDRSFTYNALTMNRPYEVSDLITSILLKITLFKYVIRTPFWSNTREIMSAFF